MNNESVAATSLERRLDEAARRILARKEQQAPGRVRKFIIECFVFVAKQAWACIFGALLLAVIISAKLWYPDDAVIARNDALTIAAILIQIGMLVFRLESGRELWVIMLFHLTGTVMELFKTDVGSWSYEAEGVLRIGGVPLFSGFMYAAVGSYMVRVYRLHDLHFTNYPRIWLTSVVAIAIYLNFFTHHFIVDLRWLLLAAIVVLWWRTVMHFRVWRATLRAPQLLIFLGVAFFIWLAENIATWGNAWWYPHQEAGWELVSPQKLVSWFLLMILSVVMVTWVYPPKPPVTVAAESLRDPSLGSQTENGEAVRSVDT